MVSQLVANWKVELMLAIGIIGTRSRNTFEDRLDVYEAIADLLTNKLGYREAWPDYAIVSGGCPQGGDNFAERWGFPVHKLIPEASTDLKTGHCNVHPALWDQYGRSAGYRRNTYIARDADWLIACVANNRKGGTEDTIKKFLAKGPEFKERLILV